jgi:hypothetical protein
MASRVYRDAEEDERLIALEKVYLDKYASKSRANDVRRQLAYLLQSKGRKKEADIYLAQIKSSGGTDRGNWRGRNPDRQNKPARTTN